jgi:hypothetical protein
MNVDRGRCVMICRLHQPHRVGRRKYTVREEQQTHTGGSVVEFQFWLNFWWNGTTACHGVANKWSAGLKPTVFYEVFQVNSADEGVGETTVGDGTTWQVEEHRRHDYKDETIQVFPLRFRRTMLMPLTWCFCSTSDQYSVWSNLSNKHPWLEICRFAWLSTLNIHSVERALSWT